MVETCGIEIKKDTFLLMDDSSKDAVMFDYLDYMKKKLDKIERNVEEDKRKQYAIAGIAGTVGGFLAMMGKFFIDVLYK